MANHGWLYLLDAREMASHWVRVRRRHIAVLDMSVRDVVPAAEELGALLLLDWIHQELTKAGPNGGEPDGLTSEELVGRYLFTYKPGMKWVGDFRHEWALDEDLQRLTRGSPDLGRRLGLHGDTVDQEWTVSRAWEETWEVELQEQQARRDAFFADRPSPLQVLKGLSGWTFLTPSDVEALREAFATIPRDDLHFGEVGQEWEGVFEAHREEAYDLAALVYTSVARIG